MINFTWSHRRGERYYEISNGGAFRWLPVCERGQMDRRGGGTFVALHWFGVRFLKQHQPG